MALAGEGAVAIWHDIAPEGRETFYAWHGVEHMPERVGIPGFVRGRRYVAFKADLEFFNLYEALSPETLAGTDYRTRLDNPTPWTRSAVAHFRDVSRSICRVAGTVGRGSGGIVATARYDVPEAAADAHRRQVVGEVLPRLSTEPGIAGAHLLVADEATSRIVTEEQRSRGGPRNEVPRWILIVEGWGDEAPFVDRVESILAAPPFGGTAPLVGFYRLQNTRLKTDWTAG